ncbi:alpha-amylase [Algoriphagus persicinus]|uniref:alpha-amylase n=1 Tax=Algoriphagus persicinus TaxID=3108754 RepID=UPI002B36DB17|nr:alpha-amylase [Algoriphagus sp. E1-3-M2]MEB2787146.1 alpha-amylase [Algoriphagus sp. E1-3-M2]
MKNGTMMQFFHWYSPEDTLWKEVKEKAEYLGNLGITSVWLPPASKGQLGGMSVGYDSYDLFDLGEFDQKGSIRTKYGTKDEFLEATQALHDRGVQVIVDFVLNHKAGGDESELVQAMRVKEENRLKNTSEPFEIEAYTRFKFPGRNGIYSDFIWDRHCFTGVDYDHRNQEHGIFNLLSEYGDDWEKMVDDEKGSYDFLMFCDIDFRNPAVRDEILKYALWLHELTFYDGVRLDAVKHIPPGYFKELLYFIRERTGKNIFAVGEYWAPGNLELLTKYIVATDGTMSLFDSALQDTFHRASTMGSQFDMREVFTKSLASHSPKLAVTLVSNHDTQPLQALEAPVESWFKPLAYALILLRQDGYPCVFYPDLFGASYWDKGEDGKDYEIFIDRVDELEPMLYARKDFAFGTQRDYFDRPNAIGWTREGDDEHGGCAVVLSNADGATISMEIGARYSGRNFRDILGKIQDEVWINEAGWADFHCAPGSVSVWTEGNKN